MEARDAIAAARAAGRPDPSRPLVAARPRWGERIIESALGLCALISVVTTTAIVISLLEPTISFFGDISFSEFFSTDDWAPLGGGDTASFGVIRIIVGTLNVTFWALLVAVPVGLLSAIYLSEYASPRVRRILKPILEVLAGVPTVAFGVFAVTFLSPLAEDVFPEFIKTPPFAAGIAGLAVGLLIVPIIASISDDAMRAVPGGLREGAYALGSTKLKVSTRVVFPAAISGIVASIVLAGSRAVGETMVVLLAAGKTPNLTFDPGASVQTMTAFIGTTATGDVATGTLAYDTIFAVGTVLFVMTLLLNLFAIRLVRRFREVYE
jgi:phosphate transport system permease protein